MFEETGTQVGKVLEETGKNLVLRKLAQEKKGELRVLGGNLKKMGYISEIKSLISELTQYAVTEEALADFLEKSKEKPHLYYKLCDVQVLYKAFHAYLADQYITAEELLEVLCRVAEQSQMIRESVIVLDGFTGFTPIQNKLMQKLMQYAKKVMVTVTIDERENPYHVEGEHQLFLPEQEDGGGAEAAGPGSGCPGGGAHLGTLRGEEPVCGGRRASVA